MGWAAWGWAAVALAAGCERPRTELVVRVESELAWGPGAAVQSVAFIVRRGGASGAIRSARTTALGDGGERRALPLRVGVIAADDDIETPVWIEALGCAGVDGCREATAVVAQRAVVRFTRGATQELTLLLASACVGVSCALDERCAAASGRCEPATRAQDGLRPFNGADAETATVVDATVDAGTAADEGNDVWTNDLPVIDVERPLDESDPSDAESLRDQPDTSRCVGECMEGATRSCGNCGTQRCSEACTWSGCEHQGACSPGTVRPRPCGNCGTQPERCSATCEWESAGECVGSGPCSPGSIQRGGCDPCSQQTCMGDCNWGECGLRPGNACEYQAGTHSRDCGACRCGRQFCLASCQWGTSCVSCCTTCGGCL